MEIISVRRTKVKVETIKNGNCFWDKDGNVYMVIAEVGGNDIIKFPDDNPANNYVIAVDLYNGLFDFFRYGIEVEPAEATVAVVTDS